MLLTDLFEQSTGEPLKPGEKRPRPDMRVRNIRNLEDKIIELQDHIYNSTTLKNRYKSDPQLQSGLENLIQRLSARKELVQKVIQHPTRSQQVMVQILKSECSDYLRTWREINEHEWQSTWLYRGNNSSVSVFEGRSRIDRRVKDSLSEVSQVLDHYLEIMGFQALRRNSIFVTTSESDAQQYGTLYLIFPKNGFEFLSTVHRDLVLDNYTYLIDDDLTEEYVKEVRAWEESQRDSWTQNSHLVDDLQSSLRWNSASGVIMAVKALSLDPQYQVPEHLRVEDKQFVTPESVRRNLQPQDSDLKTPMEDSKEILINGEYWALRADLWKSYLRKALADDTF